MSGHLQMPDTHKTVAMIGLGLMGTAMTQRLLEHGTTETVADESDDSLSERLRNTLIEFEARHPHVGGLLERITNGLSSMGI